MKKKILSEEQLQELVVYQKNHSDSNTQKKFKLTRTRYDEILLELNIKRHPVAWGKAQSNKTQLSEIDIKDIITEYSTTNITELCEKYHIKPKHLLEILRENNITIRSKEESKEIATRNFKNTMLQKYGVENPQQLSEVREKTIQTNIKLYGSKSYTQTQEYKNKRKKTCRERYGADSYSQSNVGRKRLQDNSDTWLKKKYETQKQNNTFNSSLPEDNYYKILVEKFGEQDVKRQYWDLRYPYHCDFYIISLDTFIELNLNWTHGKHPFDEHNLEDIQQLNDWKDKSLISKFYAAAITTWTIRDVAKIKTARENKLNYRAFYLFSEAEKWINQI